MIATAEKHVREILTLSIGPSKNTLIVADSQCKLAGVLAEAYRRCLPKAKFIDFDKTPPEDILTAFESLETSDLAVLIQSTNFRLGAFRIRVDLFNRGLKVIEHPHLSSTQETEIPYYIDSLAYDPGYYRAIGASLKKRIDQAKRCVIDSGGVDLVFESGLEEAKLNTGDYTGMKNVGGQFPIGEVFTEAKDLEAVNGRVRIFVFGDTAFKVNQPPKPITLVVNKGRITEAFDSTDEFERVLANIRADEGEIWVRELGFGLNRALTRERIVSDIGTYERMCGVHLSLGAKHGIYKKPQIKRKIAKHHVDVFAAAESVTLDDQVVYRNGHWTE